MDLEVQSWTFEGASKQGMTFKKILEVPGVIPVRFPYNRVAAVRVPAVRAGACCVLNVTVRVEARVFRVGIFNPC